MNRKDRRAARARDRSAPAAPAQDAAMFAEAVRLYQAGAIPQAAELCEAILRRNPGHPGSLHLSGAILQQRGAHETAVPRFQAAVRQSPDVAELHSRLGHSLMHLGRIGEGVEAIERARALDAGGAATPDPGPSSRYAWTYFNFGNLCRERGRPQDAIGLYERALALDPGLAEAHNGAGAVLLDKGRVAEAAAHLRRALELAPEFGESFSNVPAMLYRIDPALAAVVERVCAAGPQRVTEGELLGPAEFAALAGDTLLRYVLETFAVRDLDLERTLTALRRDFLKRESLGEGSRGDGDALSFVCALARQCFVNEYVFSAEPDEDVAAQALRRSLDDAISAGRDVPAMRLAVAASYAPLHQLANAQRLLERAWPAPVEALLTQQIREPNEELRLREAMPRLTAIEGETSGLVRRQYEENPYPRWTVPGSPPSALPLADFVRARLPSAPLKPLAASDGADVLIAGCGTGQHPIHMARSIAGARVLAIDLSLASLAYAQRKTRDLGVTNIEYAQADLMRLAALGRTFDLVDASGVLHHLADPFAGWDSLLPLLRPNGLMRIGLYSEVARRDVAAAQRFVAEHGFRAVAGDIRRCREALLASPLREVTRFCDFFTTSECRDLLFHVQEHRHTIPQIAAFLRERELTFLGFETSLSGQSAFRRKFPQDAAMTNLENWHSVEMAEPDTFAAMYRFWVQRG